MRNRGIEILKRRELWRGEMIQKLEFGTQWSLENTTGPLLKTQEGRDASEVN